MNNIQYCRGTWQKSARNIRYSGNTVECELRSPSGKWIPNQLRFFPRYEYENINGRFGWNNFRNNFSKQSIMAISTLKQQITYYGLSEHMETIDQTISNVDKNTIIIFFIINSYSCFIAVTTVKENKLLPTNFINSFLVTFFELLF